MRLALVHYSAPPVVGGVERIIGQQAQWLSRHGHEVVVICGNAGAAIEGVETRVVLWTEPQLRSALAGCEAVIVHNMFTMPFHDGAAQGLARLSREWRMINWVHDVDVSRPWFEGLNLHAQHVAVSESRREWLAEKLGVTETRVIPNGIDAGVTLGWTPRMESLVWRHRLLERDLLIFHPARVLQRKNMETGIEVTACLRAGGMDAAYLISGAPDPHRAASVVYAASLVELITAHGLENDVLFAGSGGVATEAEMQALYEMADLVFFPSRTEGFGLPLLEAALHRVPVLCSDIPPHREVAMKNACFFDLAESPAQIALRVRKIMDGQVSRQAREEVLRRFGWNRIYEDYLEPLLNEG